MRLTDEKIHGIIAEVIGDDTVEIIEYLKDKKDVSEFKISEKINKDIQNIRNMLYRLYNYNLVSYKRRKDRQKGWYISYWTFNRKKVKELMDRMHKDRLETYRERLEREEANKNAFFICPKACSRMEFESAAEAGYKCHECGSVLMQQDNQKTIDFLKEKIKEMEKAPAAA